MGIVISIVIGALIFGYSVWIMKKSFKKFKKGKCAACALRHGDRHDLKSAPK